MIINYYNNNKSDVIYLTKQIVEKCTNKDGNFTYPKNFKIDRFTFECKEITDVSEQLDKKVPVIIRVQNGNDSHYVVCNSIGTRGELNTYKIVDCGYKTTTIGELITLKGKGAKVTKKFIIKIVNIDK